MIGRSRIRCTGNRKSSVRKVTYPSTIGNEKSSSRKVTYPSTIAALGGQVLGSLAENMWTIGGRMHRKSETKC